MTGEDVIINSGKRTMALITTYDNPYDPSEDFRNWYIYDETILGHHTCSRLADLAFTSKGSSDDDNLVEIEDAIDRLVSEFPLIFKKIVVEINESEED